MTIQLINSSKITIGMAVITISTDNDIVSAAFSVQDHRYKAEQSPSVQEKPTEGWNEKLPAGSYGEDFEQSSELLASRPSKSDSFALKDEDFNISANVSADNSKIEPVVGDTVSQGVRNAAESDHAKLVDPNATATLNTENLVLDLASLSKDDKSRVTSPHAEEAPLTEVSAMYGADFDVSTNDISKKDGDVPVPVSVDVQKEETKKMEAETQVVDVTVAEITDARVPEVQILQEGPESEPSPDAKPALDPNSSAVSDPIPNLVSEINPSKDSILITGPDTNKPNALPSPNPKQSKVLKSLREKVSNSRKHDSDSNELAAAGRRPPIPKLSVLHVPGSNFKPAPTKEEEDAKAIELRKSRQSLKFLFSL